jgi:hypothetical protein
MTNPLSFDDLQGILRRRVDQFPTIANQGLTPAAVSKMPP